MSSSIPVLSMSHIKKSFMQGGQNLCVLKDVCIDVNQGEVVAITGPSGCGKSTLLQIAGLLDTPDSGTVEINATAYEKKSDRARTRVRRSTLGFVYQYHHLLPEFSALENVILPQLINGIRYNEAKVMSLRILEQFGLIDRAYHKPGQLSGGEQQRVAIARALVGRPALLLADEPTGNLDPVTADKIFNVMVDQVRKRALSVLMVTHNAGLASRADRVVELDAGEIKL